MARKPSAFDQFEDDTVVAVPIVKKTRKHVAKQAVLPLFNPLDSPASELELPYERSNQVPNCFPTISMPYRIAIIGDAPGEDEIIVGQPFAGQSGRLLDQIISKNNIIRNACFIGNVCQYRPPGGDLSKVPKEDIAEGVAQLKLDLAKFNPNICILLGKTALAEFHGSYDIGSWRGSIFFSNKFERSFMDGYKCLATYHPSHCLRQYDYLPLLMFDFKKAVAESKSPTWTPPSRTLKINLPLADLLYEMERILIEKPTVSVDIEGGIANTSCVSLASRTDYSVLVPFTKQDGSSYWDNPSDELMVWKRFSDIMADPEIGKVFQYGLYDRFVLQWAHNILIRNASDDTMLKSWEMYCEFPKDLGFLNSIYTQEPYYKSERKTDDQDTFYRYCCKDSATTLEISNRIESMLDSNQLDHYRNKVAALHIFLYMELRGLRYNQSLADQRLEDMKDNVYRAQEKLDTQAALDNCLTRLDFSQPKASILSQIQSICCYVRDQSKPKQSFIERGYYDIIHKLQTQPSSPELCGAISILTKTTMNTKSPVFKSYLYDKEKLAFPVQWKKDAKTKDLRPTTDYEALLKLSKKVEHPALSLALDLSRLRTRAQMLAIRSVNGRMHCSYNSVGTETERVSSSKSAIYVSGGERVGANMQTIPDDWDLEDESNPLTQGMRDLILADDGCYLGKCDLKGADGWTVGAYMAMLGDSTMLDDLKNGLKPAQVVAFILKHGADSIRGKDRNELKEMVKEIKKDDWEYFVSKQGIWGTCYTMGPRKLAERVFIESEGKVNLSEKDARTFQESIFVRYRVKIWHNWMQRHMESQPYPAKLTAPNGFTRKFFGRKNEILGESLAHMPQVITTYATNTAAFKLWTDPDNRLGKRLRVEPMHQVHDELLVQFKIEDTAWAISKLKQWFDNPIIIAGQKITVPFDGAYGTDWSMGEGSKVGDIK